MSALPMREDLMRGLIKAKRAWNEKCTATRHSVKTLSSSMDLLERHLRVDPSLAHWPRPRKEVQSSQKWCPPAVAVDFFRKEHVKRWLCLLSILRVRRLRKKLRKVKLLLRIRKQQENWSEQNGWSLSSLEHSDGHAKRGGKTRIRAAVERSRLTRLLNSQRQAGGSGDGGGSDDDDDGGGDDDNNDDDDDDDEDDIGKDGDGDDFDAQDGGTTDKSESVRRTVATFSEEGSLDGKSTASAQKMDVQKEAELQLGSGCNVTPPDAGELLPRQMASSGMLIHFRRVETSGSSMIRLERCVPETKHAADLLAEFLRKSPWSLKFSRGLRRVQSSTRVLQSQCKGFVVCKRSRLAALEQLWRKLEPNAVVAAKKLLHDEEVQLLLPRTPGLTPPWLQKTAYDLSIVREKCVEANHTAKHVAAKHAHLHQLQTRNREAVRRREKDEGDTAASSPATTASTKKRRRMKKKKKRKREGLNLPKFYSTDMSKAPDALVCRTCQEYLTKEKRRIFDQYLADKETFRRKLEVLRLLQTTEVKATDRMDSKDMARYLHESPYCVEFALTVAEENQRMDRVFAHKKELMKQQKQLLSVPLELLTIYSGGARQRFEADQQHVILALLRKRRL